MYGIIQVILRNFAQSFGDGGNSCNVYEYFALQIYLKIDLWKI